MCHAGKIPPFHQQCDRTLATLHVGDALRHVTLRDALFLERDGRVDDEVVVDRHDCGGIVPCGVAYHHAGLLVTVQMRLMAWSIAFIDRSFRSL